MSYNEIRKSVLDIIIEIAPDSDIDNVNDELSIRDHFNLDSMDFLDLVMELRKRHKVEVPKHDYPLLETMQDCVRYLLPKIGQLAA